MAAATSAAADSDAASAAAAATTAERDARANSMLVLHTEIGLMLQRSAADDGGACDLTGTMLANTAGQLRPYEASCIEVQSESTAPSCTTITSRWNTTAIGGAANLADKNAAEDTPGVGAAQQQQPSTGGVAQQRKRPAAEKRFFVVLYYETHTADGLLAFRSIAARVAAKQLPGETVNRMAFGFAMWRVPAADFQELMATPRLASS